MKSVFSVAIYFDYVSIVPQTQGMYHARNLSILRPNPARTNNSGLSGLLTQTRPIQDILILNFFFLSLHSLLVNLNGKHRWKADPSSIFFLTYYLESNTMSLFSHKCLV